MSNAGVSQDSELQNSKFRSEELRFEYDQLRKEILHNDSLSIQILGGVLILTGVLLGAAFTKEVTAYEKIALLIVILIVALTGLYQKTIRERGTSRIASYLRIFVEEQVQNVKWEIRLAQARKIELESTSSGPYGEFYAYYIYTTVILLSFVLQVSYTLPLLHDTKSLDIPLPYKQVLSLSYEVVLIGVALLLLVELFFICLSLWRSWQQFSGAAERQDGSEAVWKVVQEQERHTNTVSISVPK
jgi:hypothetical protein